jgi:hypothetical protein
MAWSSAERLISCSAHGSVISLETGDYNCAGCRPAYGRGWCTTCRHWCGPGLLLSRRCHLRLAFGIMVGMRAVPCFRFSSQFSVLPIMDRRSPRPPIQCINILVSLQYVSVFHRGLTLSHPHRDGGVAGRAMVFSRCLKIAPDVPAWPPPTPWPEDSGPRSSTAPHHAFPLGPPPHWLSNRPDAATSPAGRPSIREA